MVDIENAMRFFQVTVEKACDALFWSVRYQIAHRFPVGIPPCVFQTDFHHVMQRFRKMVAAGNMGRDKSARNVSESVIFRERLGLRHVKGRTGQTAGFQRTA